MENMKNGLSGMTGKQIVDESAAVKPAHTAPSTNVVSPTIPTPPTPVSTPKKTAIPSGSMFLSPEDAAELGISSQGQVIDVATEQMRESAEKYNRAQAEKQNELESMLNSALSDEEARYERLENTLNADAETRAELLGASAEVSTVQYSYDERRKAEASSGNPTIDLSDITPAYTDDENGIDDKTPQAEETTPDPGDDAFGEYVRDLETVVVEETPNTPVRKIREAAAVTEVSRKSYKKDQTLGDQAFLNSVTRFKKEHFGKVTVLLPNSGFFCDMVGTGVVDMTNLYINITRDMTKFDYQLEQMRVVIQNVVGTHPKVSSTALTGMIHFQDFDMLSYGLICATLDKVETVANCTECGKPFHITSRPIDLLINNDELSERYAQIENAPNIETYSLMTKTRNVTTPNGIEISLSHPSYNEMIRCIRGYQDYSKNMNEANRKRFETMLETLYMVRQVRLPNGVVTNNIFQAYQALMLLRQEDLATVEHEIENMRKSIVVPKFGIREVRCPHCHQIVKDIPYANLTELVFYHTTISSYLNNPES